jgi:shikimate 5-dehydrogenase
VLENLSGESRLFPIIGDPIRYVESPARLTASFDARGHNGVCVPMQVAEDDLGTVMRGLAATPNVDGLLVTMPHKAAAFGYCATSSDRAGLLGVVSIIRRNQDRSWHADTLDGLAFVKAQKDRARDPTGRGYCCSALAAPAPRSPSPGYARGGGRLPRIGRGGRQPARALRALARRCAGCARRL